MADYDFPADLVDLQRRFLEADAECERIAASHPRPVDVAAGTAVITDEQHEELARARATRLNLAEALNGHPWWATVDRVKAKAALRELVRGETDTSGD